MLVADTVTSADWDRPRTEIDAGAGGHSGHLYRLKVNGPNRHGGPYALLAREHHLPRNGHHNYLAIPEIVEDIARCCGLDLAQRFQRTTMRASAMIGTMIVAIEGPSAAGKTTWCQRHVAAASVIPEYALTGTEPDGTDLPIQAEYWVTVNSHRWAQARHAESATGLAVCDSDPLKLHYSWCLSMIGAAPRARFEHELAVVRTAFAAGRLGLVDVVLISIPPLESTVRS
jgi:hypothetical protein